MSYTMVGFGINLEFLLLRIFFFPLAFAISSELQFHYFCQW